MTQLFGRTRAGALGALGVVVLLGLLPALLMSRFRLAESALLPWVVLSQVVTLIALAPVVTRWAATPGTENETGGRASRRPPRRTIPHHRAPPGPHRTEEEPQR